MIKCLLVCEGPFDKLIYDLLKKVFDENKFEIIPMGCTFLDDPSFSTNLDKKLDLLFEKEKTYSKEDFEEIVYLFDTDGMFVEDAAIIKDATLKKIQYTLDEIHCIDDKSIKLRNQHRRDNVDSILTKKTTYIYYNSRNLEHAFDATKITPMNDKQKSKFALKIASQFGTDLNAFLEKLFQMNKSSELDYDKTWDYVKKGKNSLSSCSNFFVFLKDHKESLKPEYCQKLEELLKPSDK